MAQKADCLDTETVEGSALSLEGVDDVESGDGLALGVLGVGDGVSDDVWRGKVERREKACQWGCFHAESSGRKGDAHSQGRSWGSLASLRRSDRRFAWHLLVERDVGWRAWWYPGCEWSRKVKKGRRKQCQLLGEQGLKGKNTKGERRNEHVVSQDLPVSLGSSLSESLST
jgi:hypothetical protein